MAIKSEFVEFARKKLSIRELRMHFIRAVLSRFSFFRRKFACYGQSVGVEDVARRIMLADEIEETVDLNDAERDYYLKYMDESSCPVVDAKLRIHYRSKTYELADCQILPKSAGILDVASERIITHSGNAIQRNLVRPYPYRETLHIAGLTISLLSTPRGHSHYFHFLFDMLKPLIEICRKIPEAGRATVLIRENLAPHQELAISAVQSAWPDLNFRRMPDNVRIQCERLLFYVKSLQIGSADFGDQATLRTMGSMLSAAPGTPELPQDQLIMISRAGQKTRVLINEDEVFEKLRPLGFRRVSPESLSIAEQISLFSSAKIIVGACGAALTNMLYCRPGTTLIEICPLDFHQVFWIVFAKQMGMNHYFVPGSEGGVYQAFSVDTDAVLRAVEPAHNTEKSPS